MNMSVAALVLKQEPYSHVIDDRVSCQWTIHFTYFASSICSCHVCFNYNINSHFPFMVEFVCLLKQLIDIQIQVLMVMGYAFVGLMYFLCCTITRHETRFGYVL